MTKQSQTPPYKIGDKVTTDFHEGEGHVVRTVTDVYAKAGCQSRWMVIADAGVPCDKCQRPNRGVWAIDSDWFKRVLL